MRLWVLIEGGATFVFPHEVDARRAIVTERAAGLRVEELIEVDVPKDEHESYAQAVLYDLASAHLHPTFTKADREVYPVIHRERLDDEER